MEKGEVDRRRRVDFRRACPARNSRRPAGPVKIDEKNHHTWLWPRIGKANEQGQFDIVWKLGGSHPP